VRFAVIMSGGSGRRFWPLSRTARAKQLIPFMSGKSLLEITVERLTPLFDPAGIIVVTQKQQYEETARVLERWPDIRILSEPVGRNTAACIAFACTYVDSVAGDAVVAFVPADHLITYEERFREVLSAGMDFVEETGKHLTLGIKPNRPATGFGYIKKGEQVKGSGGLDFFQVTEFTEKPSLERASAYLESGDYLWNAGIFVFRVSSIRDEIKTHLPDTAREFEILRDCLGESDQDEKLAACYSRITGISIDYGVMEKTRTACVIPADIGWDDVGTWDSFFKYMNKDGMGNAVHGKHVGIDSSRCLIYSDKQVITTLGISGLAVIATDDAVLVMPRERGEEVKRIVESIEHQGLDHLL
jgi:mannose-1-phosphate guanylyltransferase